MVGGYEMCRSEDNPKVKTSTAGKLLGEENAALWV